jgi:hypothetical protein
MPLTHPPLTVNNAIPKFVFPNAHANAIQSLPIPTTMPIFVTNHLLTGLPIRPIDLPFTIALRFNKRRDTIQLPPTDVLLVVLRWMAHS